MKVYHMNKMNLMFGAFFSAFAILVLIVGIFIQISWVNFKKNSAVTDAVIVDIRSSYNHSSESTDHTVIVEYIVDGELYRDSLGYYTSRMRIGDHVSVHYDLSDPSHTMSNPAFATVIMVVLILAFGGFGGGFLIYEFSLRRVIIGLINEDKYIVCDHTVVREEVSAHVKVNGTYYRQMNFLYHTPDGTEYVFSSRPYHPDKNPFIDGNNVIVYVDIEKDPKKYYVSDE